MLQEFELEILMFTLWSVFVAYITWYLTSAKHFAPITPREGGMLWKIHKSSAHCSGRRWRTIKRGSKIVGFECECGYRHVQRRPIVANMPQSLSVPSENQKASKSSMVSTPNK
jgi:hypothetical protein